MQKTIIQIIDNLRGGGAQRSTMKIAKGFANDGHNVHLIIIENKMDYSIDFNINVHHLNYSKSKIPLIIIVMLKN